MAISVYTYCAKVSSSNFSNRTSGHNLRFHCDTEAELPTSNLLDGDIATTGDTYKRFRRISGSWVTDLVIDVIAVGLQETSGPTGLSIGTISDTQFLKRVGNTLVGAVPTASVAWGGITGTLSAQTDLQSALDAKAASSHIHDWADVTGEPTTLAGYGITDGATDAELAAHEGDATNVHGIANTANLALLTTKLDDFDTPDDNTDLNASVSAHGLMQKYPGGTTNFLRADGTFAAPTAAAADPGYSPGSFTVVTETQRFAPHRLKMTTSQRITIEGTGRLSCLN